MRLTPPPPSCRPKPARIMVGILIGVSKGGKLYSQRATQYAIDSGRINNRKGAPLGYIGVWKLKAVKREH